MRACTYTESRFSNSGACGYSRLTSSIFLLVSVKGLPYGGCYVYAWSHMVPVARFGVGGMRAAARPLGPYGQACNWAWDDWDDRDSKGIWEIYASIYIFNAHLLIHLYVFAMLATSPATI